MMHWSAKRARLTGEPLALHKRQLRRLSDAELEREYRLCMRSLALDEGKPTSAAKVQYFIECWRELRRRRRN